MKIASHHNPASPMPLNADYHPICSWPDNCTVQWGRSDTFAPHDGPIRAFFEAFTKSGMVRGDAGSIEDAEASAFAKYTRESACDHGWRRRKFDNGYGKCMLCGASLSKAFKPIVTLGSWADRPNQHDLDMIVSGWIRPRAWIEADNRDKHLRRIFLQARYHGIDIPDTPAEPMTEAQFMNEADDPYADACTDAVEAYMLKGEHGLIDLYRDQVLRSISDVRKVRARRRSKPPRHGSSKIG